MIAATRSFSNVSIRSPQGKDGVAFVKNPARFESDQVRSSRKWFAALLWQAFPSPSERDVAHKAAAVLDCSPRQVTNWLRCEHSAAWHYVSAVMMIAGVEVVLRRVDRQ